MDTFDHFHVSEIQTTGSQFKFRIQYANFDNMGILNIIILLLTKNKLMSFNLLD